MIDPHLSLWLSGGLLCLGIVGAIVRRSAVSAFLSLELMLCSAILALTSFDLIHQQTALVNGPSGVSVAGRGFAVMIFSIAIAQAFVGLALLIAKRRNMAPRAPGSAQW